ncbi:MAG: hypothetical protein P1U41_10870 [Vicingaceae bacterium]|nr:hypothetical protein [Vicingaceae bacterium]
MKKVLIAVSVFCLVMVNNSYANGSANMKKQLDEVVKFENNTLLIKSNETAFVKVSFKINGLGKIEVLESNYSNENIKQQLMEKLNEITVKNQHDVDEVYYYNFTFKKV